MPVEKWSDHIWIVKLSDEPALSDDLSALLHEAGQAETYPNHVVDFSGITTVSSSNLSQLLRLRKQAIDHDTKMRLVAIPDQVWVVFLTTGLDKVFDFAPDVTTALASLQLDESENR